MKADKKDKAILNALVEDSRLSYRQIARKVGLAVSTVMKRVKKLEQEGIIKGYTVLMDYAKLGYDMQVIIDLRVGKGKMKDVEKRISTHPNVYAVYDNTGNFDATIMARFKSRSALDGFLKKVQGYDFVERTETKLVLASVKEEPITLQE